MANPTAQPPAVLGKTSSPWNAARMQNAMPAPVMITALAPTAGTEPMTLSPTRM